MASIGALHDEFVSLRRLDARCRADLDEAEQEDVWQRVSDLRTMIDTRPPASAADCAMKLRVVLDPLGMGVGEDPDDEVSLRQVAEFLETRR